MAGPSTRERLIRSAADLCDTGGEEAVTIRAVASASGVTHNAPYNHFANRGGLIAAMTERDGESLVGFLAALQESRRPPLAALRTAVKAIVTFARLHPARYRLIFKEVEVEAEVNGAVGRIAEAIQVLVQRCTVSGEFEDTNPPILGTLLLATLHGLLAMEKALPRSAQVSGGSLAPVMDLLLSMMGKNS